MNVAQRRKRIIFMGVRNDLELKPRFPSPLTHNYFISEVLPHIKAIKRSGFKDNWQKPFQPAPTFTQSDGKRESLTGYMSSYLVRDRYSERRKWTIDELKYVSSFPEDFKLTGTFGQQWERVARAVPPSMMFMVAQKVKEILNEARQRTAGR
jgi:DNA (cytosine-5)-methyltransferase 1